MTTPSRLRFTSPAPFTLLLLWGANALGAAPGCAQGPEPEESGAQAVFGRGQRSVHELRVPGLVLGLRHNLHQDRESGRFAAGFTTSDSEAQRMEGGDLESDTHRGFEWWMLSDVGGDPLSLRLPPGVLVALKHSENNAQRAITAFGHDAVTGPASFPGFQKQFGGDLGANGGQGYFWYESTGENVDWSVIDRLPRYTVVGFKHTHNQPNKTFVWNGVVYDSANPGIAAPPGFERRVSLDSNYAKRQVFYCWYEKVVPDREIVVRSPPSATLDRSPFMSGDDDPSADRDGDGLRDEMENWFAERFRPLLKFDSSEKARQWFEPLTLFQVRPKAEGEGHVLRIKWVFLFGWDGGYGPSSRCLPDSHIGDNDTALFELESSDSRTWTLRKVDVGWKGHGWPANSRLEVHELQHPIIYVSGSKHHQYLTRDRDHKGSLYSGFWDCDEDVDGGGTALMPELRSVDGVRFNNVGEPERHGPDWGFIDDLAPFYPGHSAWENQRFYHPNTSINGMLWLRD